MRRISKGDNFTISASAAARWTWAVALVAGLLVLAYPARAFAHASDRGHVLLLPTDYYIFGGAVAVALTFAVLALGSLTLLERFSTLRIRLIALPQGLRFAGSLGSFIFLAALIVVGFAGSRDPLSNPLPLMVWTVFWVGLALLQGSLGDLWRWINPWYAPWRALAWLIPGAREAKMPQWLGYWPAFIQFFAFAWFELVYPAPDDPARLAIAVAGYFTINLGAALLFGFEGWMKRGECLSAFLRLIAQLAIIEGRDGEGRRHIALCLPGAKLIRATALPVSGTLFLLLALSTVSFDGLMRTFFWLGQFGINPLEFPGRSAVMGISTFGIVAMFVLLSAAFVAAVWIGDLLTNAPRGWRIAAGHLVWSIIPISLAYHFSHYLVVLVINGQYALAALSDPLMNGADLIGTAGMHVQAGLLMGAEAAWLVWNLQSAAIIGGHVLAVLVAHVIAARLYGNARDAALSQLPLAALMVGYTVFGLWLLASPTAG